MFGFQQEEFACQLIMPWQFKLTKVNNREILKLKVESRVTQPAVKLAKEIFCGDAVMIYSVLWEDMGSTPPFLLMELIP